MTMLPVFVSFPSFCLSFKLSAQAKIFYFDPIHIHYTIIHYIHRIDVDVNVRNIHVCVRNETKQNQTLAD